jgi:hypothetical protein
MANYPTWNEEDRWWREHYVSRPYAAGRSYEEFQPAYRYGYESGVHHMGRTWDEVREDLRTGWDKFEGKGPGGAAWEDVKDAVREAWYRVTGKHDLDAEKMSETEFERLSRGEKPR